MNLDRPLSELIPHGEGMCLIDSVVEYDEKTIHCRTDSHTNPDNPLAEGGRLSSLAIVEYASQAAAIHAALGGPRLAGGRAAYVGLVKALRVHCELLSDIAASIDLKAECILSQDNGAVYRFQAYTDSPIADGQLNLVVPGEG